MNLSAFWTHAIAFFSGVVALGFLIMPFALLVAAHLLSQRRTPASSVTWLLAIMLVPVLGIPLFWLFGNRKISRIAHQKVPVALSYVDKATIGETTSALHAAASHFGYEGLTRGNTLRFHANGEEAYADLMALIDGAKQSIDIETFVLKHDGTGKAILERLAARAKEGIKVRLLIDGLGSFHMRREPLRRLKRAGGSTAFFMPIWRFTLLNRSNLRDHRKIAVFDGLRVFAGGRNLAEEYLGSTPSKHRWADFSFVLEGPATLHYTEIFGFDWAFATGGKFTPVEMPSEANPAEDRAIIQVVPSGPDVAEDELFEGILSFIFAAKQRLWIVTPYFIPSEMLFEALRIAAQRGVDLRIVVPQKSDQRLPDLARTQFLRDLKALGAKPLLYTPGMIHAKAVLVDDVVATVGSANFDSRSMFLNFEVSSVIYSKTEILAVRDWIEKLMQETRAFDPAVGQRREFAEGIARLIAPLL